MIVVALVEQETAPGLLFIAIITIATALASSQISRALFTLLVHELISSMASLARLHATLLWPRKQVESSFDALCKALSGGDKVSVEKGAAQGKLAIGAGRDCGAWESKSASNKVFLMKNLMKLCMKEGSTVFGHLNEFNSLFSQLTSQGFSEFDDELKSIFLLCSLPNSWDIFCTSINYCSDGLQLVPHKRSQKLQEEGFYTFSHEPEKVCALAQAKYPHVPLHVYANHT
ncbi:hypothetical protein L7F22_045004 [Adiantum nelumboides]|nr:hypothetical protein [Adiantum nelumboides]